MLSSSPLSALFSKDVEALLHSLIKRFPNYEMNIPLYKVYLMAIHFLLKKNNTQAYACMLFFHCFFLSPAVVNIWFALSTAI